MVDKPVVQYLVEEAVEAGIEEVIFVTGRGKRAIEDHFDTSFELEETLVEKSRHELLESVRKISELAKFSYVRQSMPLGDGHAILQAAHVVGNEPVLVLFGDCIYDSTIPASKQLLNTFQECDCSVVGMSRVELDEVSKFGVIEGTRLYDSTYEITKLIEKPKPNVSKSNLVAVGKYIITPEVMSILAGMTCGNSGEIRLIDAFQILLDQNRPLYGRELQGEWLDTGDKFNFIKATIKLGLKHPEVGKKLREYLKGLNL